MSSTKFCLTYVLVLCTILTAVQAIFKGIQIETQSTANFVALITLPGASNEIMGAGAIVKQNAIVTTASLVKDKVSAPADVKVYVGNLNYKLGARTVKSIIINPSYSTTTQVFDIAVVILATPLTLSTSIGLARFPTQGQQYAEIPIEIYGWGQVGVNDYSTLLRRAPVNTTFNTMCTLSANSPAPNAQARPEDICTLTTEGRLCDGDSGGPMVLANTNIVIGFFKFLSDSTATCEDTNSFSVGERFTKNTVWVNTTLLANP